MAYTQVINAASPANVDKVEFGALQIRELKRDLVERLASVFVDANADPLVLKASSVGTTVLADLSVTTGKLAASAVTAAKLAALAVTPASINTALAFEFNDVELTGEVFQSSGRSVGHRSVSAGGDLALNAETTNHHRHSVSSNSSITFANFASGQSLLLELHIATGGVSIAIPAAKWPNGNTVPTFSNVLDRKDVILLVGAGADILGFVVGQNIPSVT